MKKLKFIFIPYGLAGAAGFEVRRVKYEWGWVRISKFFTVIELKEKEILIKQYKDIGYEVEYELY